ncbi:MAG: tRNA (N6-threonylcarbamoyladenosine(37)-N6)-methyltransferase TrmO [archaeon]|nr:tRNA (N6-threonylcarbamoyladenosine(37)-N6)-methyltransferase TrmO [archaeon]
MIKEFGLKPIGYVRTDADEDQIKKDRKNVISEIIISEELTEALDGIEDFSHLFIIFYMHKAFTERINLKVHPRGRLDLPLVGVFATRSPYRPNPIGLTLVELIKRKGNKIKVRGLDAINGTPIIDIKPYDPLDLAMKARVPEWWMKLHQES